MSNPEAAKPAAAKGMAGMVVGDTSVGYVDGAEGILEYRGYDIRVLAENSTFEEVAYLLWNGRLPVAQELQAMKAQAPQRAVSLPQEVIAALRIMPKNADPMAVMRTAVSMLAHYDPESEENSPVAHQHKACRLLGQISDVVAAYERIRHGEEPIKPRMDLDHAANFLWMLTGEDPEPLAAKALDQYLLLLAEHELNASTFTARDRVHRLGAALGDHRRAGCAERPAHGAAVQEAMVQFLEIGSPDNVENWFEKGRRPRAARDGHRPPRLQGARPARRALMKNVEMMVDATGERQWFDIASKLEAVATQDPYFKDRNLGANVDFYSAPLLYSIGIPVDAFTCMFAMSRIVGWTAHVYEQQSDNRLIRPLGNYTGQHQLPWTPMEQRK